MEKDERITLLRIALYAQRLLARLDRMTTKEFSEGGDKTEREALRAALLGTTAPTDEYPSPSRRGRGIIRKAHDLHPQK